MRRKILLKVKNREPVICSLILLLIIFEVPYFNLFLMAATLLYIILVIIYKRKAVINKQAIILFLFIILYFIIDSNLRQSNTYKIFYILSVGLLYLCGYYATFDKSNNIQSTKKIFYAIQMIAIGYFSYVIITLVWSVIKGQMSISRNPLNIWTGQLRAATHFGTMLVIPVAYGIWLTLLGENRKRRLYGIMMVLTAAIINVITASRTILLFIPIGFVICYFYSIVVKGKFSRNHLYQLILCILIVMLSMVVINLNLFNIQDKFVASALGQRYATGHVSTIAEDGRMKHWLYFFAHLGESFWGGGFTRIHSGNLHNIYFNVYDLSGIIPFTLLIAFTVMGVKNIKKVCYYDLITDKLKVLIIVVYSLTLLQLLMEPVMESVPTYFWCILYLSGMVDKLAHNQRRNTKCKIS